MKGYAPRRTYSRELTLLPSVYAQFAGAPIPDLHDWVTGAKRGPLLVVGSGGALAVARLTADLHEIGTGRPAKALTPSELTTAPQDPSSSLLLLSAGARHPDVLAAARIATSRGYRSIALLTLRPPAELPGALLRPDVRPIALPSQPGREGFLATTSVLSMAVALARAYAELDQSLPKYLSLLQEPMDRQTGPVSLVLTGPGHSCAGVDFETRMSELGLSHVQLTDYRNFAHGRHAGFNRNIETTTVVAFVAPKYRELAEATLAQLPKDANLLKIETNELWPVSALELIVGSMHITGSTARAAGIEPSRPGVPSFGRRLYHLRDPGSPPTRGIGPVERKVLACGSSIDDLDLLEGYAAAFERWKASLRKISFRGIVLDYDGTCCETSHRFDLTPEPVRVVLTRLLESDAILGFASGRGASLHRDLRKWIPKPPGERSFLGCTTARSS